MLPIALLILTNIAVVLVVTVTFSILGVDNMLAANGIDMNLSVILLICSLIGFGGAFISLFLSKWLARRSMGVNVIDRPTTEAERWLVSTVQQLSRQAGIRTPDIGVFESPEPNAFATGWNRDAALVAVSTGLLEHLDQDEVRAVLGHEIGHAANGDMVTLTLVQGVMNTFVLFLSWIVGSIIDKVVFRNDRGLGIGFWIARYAAQLVFGIGAAVIVAWFSRWREFRADQAGAELAGRQHMIGALRSLQRASHEASELPGTLAAFGISAGTTSGLTRLLASHPPLDVRIAALESGR